MTTLHLGTRDVDALRALLPTDAVDVFVEEHAWDIWGESEPGAAHHVIVRTRDARTGTPELLADVACVMGQHPGLLEPMQHIYQAGTIAVITADDDWSEAYWTLQDVKAGHRIRRTCTHPRSIPVPYEPGNDYWGNPLKPRTYCRDCHSEGPIETSQAGTERSER